MLLPSPIRVAVLEPYDDQVRRIVSSAFYDMTVDFVTGQERSERIAVCRDADVLLVGSSPVSEPLLAEAKRARVVHKLGVGVDTIDLEAARRRNIAVFLAAGVNADAVAEMTVLLMLCVLRNLPWAVAELRQGRHQKEALRGTTYQLRGMSVGLLGFGHVGTQVARRLQGFDVDVLYHDIHVRPHAESFGAGYAGLERLVTSSDILSLHLPWTPATDQILNRARLESMRVGAAVVNTARGRLIDEEALCDALERGMLRGAALDVTEDEPIRPDSRLLGCDRVILTPHMGGAVVNNFAHVARRAAANIRRLAAGLPVDERDVAHIPAGLPPSC